METFEAEGIDVDLVDQMKGLGLEEEAAPNDPTKSLSVFAMEKPSTKVSTSIPYCLTSLYQQQTKITHCIKYVFIFVIHDIYKYAFIQITQILTKVKELQREKISAKPIKW